jgi:hypothetical protein
MRGDSGPESPDFGDKTRLRGICGGTAPGNERGTMSEPSKHDDPRNEPIYRGVLWVLVASVLAGAVLTLTGEPLFGSRALANVGLGMAVVCGALYWVFRLLGRSAARRAEDRRDRQGR